jgi:uncharacterized protein
MADFAPGTALSGGALIGVAAAAMLLLAGRTAGVAGIFAGVLRPVRTQIGWQAAFVAGLIAGGVLVSSLHPECFRFAIDRSFASVAAAGLLVGFGTRLGSGCTSGHGICGVARLSRRSIVATVTFTATGALAVFVVNHLLGGKM